MLDHIFTDAIGAVRSALELALLERVAVEERFTTDALSGDIRWESSFGLPGEGQPPRVQADLTLSWPTWSQAAYRTWLLTRELHTIPELDFEVAFRSQSHERAIDPERVIGALPSAPTIGRNPLSALSGPTLEATFSEDLTEVSHAIELQYSGSIELHDQVLADGNLLDELLAGIGGWISGMLVALSDA